jgi:hypothetical protein
VLALLSRFPVLIDRSPSIRERGGGRKSAGSSACHIGKPLMSLFCISDLAEPRPNEPAKAGSRWNFGREANGRLEITRYKSILVTAKLKYNNLIYVYIQALF